MRAHEWFKTAIDKLKTDTKDGSNFAVTHQGFGNAGAAHKMSDLEGIIIGTDSIPVLPDVLAQLDDYTFDNLVIEKGNGGDSSSAEQYEVFVKNNKHNQVTSTYYLLLKKRERKTGRNYLFEIVTSKKRTGG